MMREAMITIEFTDYWLSGTGRAGEGDVDAVAHRDRFGCPAMPMSQVKGQLRESAKRLGWERKDLDRLFGWEKLQEDDIPPENPEAALAFRGEATISLASAKWFAENGSARQQLYRRISSTKIGSEGAAADETLRTVEAAVPLTLTGRVLWVGESDPHPKWPELLDAACAATLAFGKLKSDGFGRAVACCKEVAS